MKPAIDDDSEGVAETAALKADIDKALREDNVPDIRRAFGDVLDTLATPRGSSTWSLPEATAAEEVEQKKLELQVLEAIKRKVEEALVSQGIFLVGVADAALGDGWIFYSKDREGRPYEAVVSFAEQNALSDIEGPRGVVDRLAKSVIEGLLAERQEWFRRAGYQ